MKRQDDIVPQISVLLATYEPRIDWLYAQLKSLAAQTYPNFRLYLRDDGSKIETFRQIENAVCEEIRAFPYEIRRNEANFGSTATFERLTQEADGAYFAYCDQDDVWLPEKLATLQRTLKKSGASLVCSDMYVIDAEGRMLSDSIKKIRRRQRFDFGKNPTERLLVSNFVTGCTMLMDASAAKKAIPFCPYMVHDHYLALCCAAGGGVITALRRPLIRYRIHGRNQTGVLAGVTDQKSYGEIRIQTMLERFRWLKSHFPYRDEWEDAIEKRLRWTEARQSYWNDDGGAATLWKYRSFNVWCVLFELLTRRMPEAMFRQTVRFLQKS